MKKYFIVFLMFLSFIIFISCSGGGTVTQNNTTEVIPSVIFMFQDGVYPSTYYSGTNDNFLKQNLYYTNYGNDIDGYIGIISGYDNRYVLKFDVTDIVPKTITVNKAYIYLYATEYNGDASGLTFNVYALSTDWDETTSSWVSCTASTEWNTYGGDFDSNTKGCFSVYQTGDITFEIDSTMVENWIKNSSTNYGILIKISQLIDNKYIKIISSENASFINRRPKLVVYYTLN